MQHGSASTTWVSLHHATRARARFFGGRVLGSSCSNLRCSCTLGDETRLEIREEVEITYPGWRRQFPGVRLIMRQGKPYEVDDLSKVSLHAARKVVVMGTGHSPSHADSHTLTTLMASAACPRGSSCPAPPPSSPSCSSSRTCTSRASCRARAAWAVRAGCLARRLACRGARAGREHSAVISLVPLCASRAVDLLAVLCATAPAAGRVLQELMRTQGSEIYSVPVHGQLVGGSLAAAARGAPFALSSASCANTTPARRSHPSDT